MDMGNILPLFHFLFCMASEMAGDIMCNPCDSVIGIGLRPVVISRFQAIFPAVTPYEPP
jgi:hypothetical protein